MVPVTSFVLALLVSPACFAAVELGVTVGLGGHARLGAWTPVRVVVDNKGEATRGELVIPPQEATDPVSDYRVAVDVPPSSRRAFEMYVRARTSAPALRVEFRPRTGAKVAKEATCAWHDPRSRIVLAISRKAGGFGAAGTAQITDGVRSTPSYTATESVVTYVTPDRSTGALGLPDRAAGYEGMSAVVLRDVSPADFEDSERDALIAWVESGGLLVIVAGPNVAELRDSFIEKLSPLKVRGQTVLPHLGALAEYSRQNLKYGRALVANTEAKPDATVTVSQGGLPLLASRRYASGMVCFLTADCTAPPLDSADALLTEIWSDILASRHPAEGWSVLGRLQPHQQPLIRGGLSPGLVQLPVLRWEAFALFGGYLLAYIAALVIANVGLKRLDRREWTGQATVVVIVAFSLGAYFVGSSEKLAACRTYDAGVAALRSGSSVAWLEGASGIRSPASRRYNVAAGTGEQTIEYIWGARREVHWPLGEYATFGLREMPLDLWGSGVVRVQGPWRMEGRITTRVVAVDQNRIAISIENGTPYDLRWPFVLLPGAPVTMEGLILAGSTRETDPFESSRLRRSQAATPESPLKALTEHCKAEDKRTASSSEARIRHRLLRQLGATESDAPSPSGSSWYPSFPSPTQPQEVSALLPEQPIFGAWVQLKKPLLDVSPSAGLHVSEVLVLVALPDDTTLPGPRSGRFSDLLPTIDASSFGVEPAENNALRIAAGEHQLRFRLPMQPTTQKASALALSIRAKTPGLKAEVYNYKRGRWEEVRVDVSTGPSAVEVLTPADNYVRGPWVKVRLSHRQKEPLEVNCALSGECAPR
jgi:hypothetical protein